MPPAICKYLINYLFDLEYFVKEIAAELVRNQLTIDEVMYK